MIIDYASHPLVVPQFRLVHEVIFWYLDVQNIV